MSSILKVDTIQDQSGNNIINESGNVITIGASGDTITVPAGATVSGFTSAGIDDNATSTAITISSAENVGIGGAASSTQRLIVNGDGSNIIGGIEFRNAASGGSTASIGMASGTSNALSIAVNDAANMVFKNTGGTERMRITSAGLVGIGTSSPTHNLTVDGGTSTSVSLIKDETGSATVRYYNGGSQKSYIQLTADEDMDFYAASGVDQVFYGNGAEVMRLSSGVVFNEGSGDRDFRVESNNNANMLFVDGGNDAVGIGAVPTEATHALLVQGSNGTLLMSELENLSGPVNFQLTADDTEDCRITFGDKADNGRGRIVYSNTSEHMRFEVNNLSEKARIDASGNLFVAKTSAAYQTVGHELLASGRAFHTADGGKALSLNRLTSNGAIVDFYRLGTEIGNIGTAGSGTFYIAEATYGGLAFSTVGAGDINPCTPTGAVRDNAMDLGQPTARFKDLYLGGGAFLGGTGTANKLDDYEEGTFTPAITSASGSVTNSTQTGNYTKVGRLVYFDIRVILSAISSPSGSLTIAGLPFTGGISGRTGLVKFTTVANAGTLNLTNIMGAYIATGNQINVSSNDGLNSNASQLTATTQFDLSGMYQTN